MVELENNALKNEAKQDSKLEDVNVALLQDANLDTKALAYFPGPVSGPHLPRLDLIAQEGRLLGQMLDSGNFQWAASRLQADLIQLRPNRYAQNALLNQVNMYDRKGIGSDLSLGYYNPYTASFSHGYVIPSVYRPYPTYPVYY